MDISVSYESAMLGVKNMLNDVRSTHNCYYKQEFQTNGKNELYPHTCYRSAYATACTWLYVALNCPTLATRTRYHSNVVLSNRHKIQTFSQEMNNKYDLNVGDKFYIFDEILALLITGDGVKISNVPKPTQNTSIASIRFPIFDKNIFFSKNSMVVFFVSSLNKDNDYISGKLYQCLKSMSDSGVFKIWSIGMYNLQTMCPTR